MVKRHLRDDMRTSRKMTKQRRPSGPMNETPRTWKDGVLARMTERGVKQADLAHGIGVSEAAISGLFKQNKDGSEKVKSSRLKPKVEKFLKMQPTTSVPVNNAKAEIDAKWPTLDDEDHETVRRLVASLAEKNR
jgi:ribosome-binding protein aMBF1 (putative translation factor)